ASMPCSPADLREIVRALGPDEGLGNLTVGELKAHCVRLGLKRSGGKRELIKQIAEHVEAARREPGCAPPCKAARLEPAAAPQAARRQLAATTEDPLVRKRCAHAPPLPAPALAPLSAADLAEGRQPDGYLNVEGCPAALGTACLGQPEAPEHRRPPRTSRALGAKRRGSAGHAGTVNRLPHRIPLCAPPGLPCQSCVARCSSFVPGVRYVDLDAPDECITAMLSTPLTANRWSRDVTCFGCIMANCTASAPAAASLRVEVPPDDEWIMLNTLSAQTEATGTNTIFMYRPDTGDKCVQKDGSELEWEVGDFMRLIWVRSLAGSLTLVHRYMARRAPHMRAAQSTLVKPPAYGKLVAAAAMPMQPRPKAGRPRSPPGDEQDKWSGGAHSDLA
ncbi:unnamed protein product, partial [Prorocentrum cordatum]